MAVLNYLREALTTLNYRYTLAERSRSQYSHILFRIAIDIYLERVRENPKQPRLNLRL